MITANELLVLLDGYYFNELLPNMHPILRSIATDKRLLHLNKIEEHISSLTAVFSESYVLLPWQCADILIIPEESLLAISQAHVPLLVAYLILDQLVDGQIPEALQLAPLIYSHFLLAARQKLEDCLPVGHVFWESFETYMHTLFDGLAGESASLDQHDPLYTENVMRDICHEKTAPFRLAAHAISKIASNPMGGELCETLIDTMFLGDQLTDDTLDMIPDFSKGRITCPHLKVMEHHHLTEHDFQDLTIDELRELIQQDRFEVDLLSEVQAIYESGRNRLREAGYPDSRWDSVMIERLKRTDSLRRRQTTRRFFEAIAMRM